MATGAWIPRWLCTAHTNALGEQKTLHLKASQSSTGEVLCYFSKGRVKVGDEVSRIRPAFSLFLSKVDVEYAQCSKDSFRLLLATVPKGGQIQDHPTIHDGHVSDKLTLCTTGFCIVRLYWANRRHVKHEKRSAHLQHASWPENLGTDEGMGITVVEQLLWLYGIALECPWGKAMFRMVLEHLCTVINAIFKCGGKS